MLISKNSSEVQGFLGFLAKFAVKFRRLVVNWSIGPNYKKEFLHLQIVFQPKTSKYYIIINVIKNAGKFKASPQSI